MIIKKRILVKYTLTVCTGLHIGGNKETYGIGGIDSPVIKDPLTNQPIIPGSSVKGKMRMLLERVGKDQIHNLTLNKAFGYRAENKKGAESIGISRILFRDLFLTENSQRKLQSRLGEDFFTEVKAENQIDNLKVSANPRFIERVPAGTVFSGECVVQYLDIDKDEDFLTFLKTGFELLKHSALGGSGSRGYGKIDITIESEEEI